MQDFDSSNHPTPRVLTLTGHLDALQTLRLEKFIEEAHQGTCRHVLLNLSNVATMDIGGVGNLFTWDHALHINKVRLSLVSPIPYGPQYDGISSFDGTHLDLFLRS